MQKSFPEQFRNSRGTLNLKVITLDDNILMGYYLGYDKRF